GIAAVALFECVNGAVDLSPVVTHPWVWVVAEMRRQLMGADTPELFGILRVKRWGCRWRGGRLRTGQRVGEGIVRRFVPFQRGVPLIEDKVGVPLLIGQGARLDIGHPPQPSRFGVLTRKQPGTDGEKFEDTAAATVPKTAPGLFLRIDRDIGPRVTPMH